MTADTASDTPFVLSPAEVAAQLGKPLSFVALAVARGALPADCKGQVLIDDVAALARVVQQRRRRILERWEQRQASRCDYIPAAAIVHFHSRRDGGELQRHIAGELIASLRAGAFHANGARVLCLSSMRGAVKISPADDATLLDAAHGSDALFRWDENSGRIVGRLAPVWVSSAAYVRWCANLGYAPNQDWNKASADAIESERWRVVSNEPTGRLAREVWKGLRQIDDWASNGIPERLSIKETIARLRAVPSFGGVTLRTDSALGTEIRRLTGRK